MLLARAQPEKVKNDGTEMFIVGETFLTMHKLLGRDDLLSCEAALKQKSKENKLNLSYNTHNVRAHT